MISFLVVVLASLVATGCGSSSPLDVVPGEDTQGGVSASSDAPGITGPGASSATGSPPSGATTDGAVARQVPAAVDAGADLLGAAAVCTSGTQWTSGNRGSPLMHPGVACLSCHASGRAPRFVIAGSIYATAHEPNDCNGSLPSAMASVFITGADGATLVLPVNNAGNFYSLQPVVLPFKAKVASASGERSMLAAQRIGDCNSCHTQAGANGAPGRIILP
jgi:hypothetical protein